MRPTLSFEPTLYSLRDANDKREGGTDRLGGDGIIANGVFADLGVRFEYPEKDGWKYDGQGNDPASFAYLVDENTKFSSTENSDGHTIDADGHDHEEILYGANIDILGYETQPEIAKKTAYEITDESFSPIMIEMQGKGNVKSFSLSKETIGKHEIGVMEYLEVVEGIGDVSGRWVVIKTPKNVYILFAQSKVEHKASMESAVRKIVETFEVTE